MKRFLQVMLIKIAVNACLLIFKREIIHLHFIYEKSDNLRSLTKNHDVYLIKDGRIHKYYIYGDPSQQLVSDEYHSVQDLILNILTSSMYSKIHMDSMKILYQPHLISDVTLKKYLADNRKNNATLFENTIMSMEVAKHYYNLLYKRLDKYVNNYFISKINNLIFKNSSIDATYILGVWKYSGETRRHYTQQGFSITYRLDNGTEKKEHCDISNISHKIISMKVIAYDKRFNYEERLLLSEDKNTLVVYNSNGRSIWKNIE